MDFNKLSSLERRILRELAKSTGEPLSKKEIAKRVSVSQTAVAKALTILEKEELARVRNVGNVKLTAVELNLENEDAARFKRIDNLQQLYDYGLVEELTKSHPGTTFILFGSYERGEDTTRSDIDLALIGAQRPIQLKSYEDKLHRRINILPIRKFSDVPSLLKTNIMNGYVLLGHLT